jgi:hypothetical protein
MAMILFSSYLLALSNLFLIPTAESYSVIFGLPRTYFHLNDPVLPYVTFPLSFSFLWPFNLVLPSLVLLIFGRNGKWRIRRSSVLMSVESVCVTLITSKLIATVRRPGMFPHLASWIKFAGTPMVASPDGSVRTAAYRT